MKTIKVFDYRKATRGDGEVFAGRKIKHGLNAKVGKGSLRTAQFIHPPWLNSKQILNAWAINFPSIQSRIKVRNEGTWISTKEKSHAQVSKPNINFAAKGISNLHNSLSLTLISSFSNSFLTAFVAIVRIPFPLLLLRQCQQRHKGKRTPNRLLMGKCREQI